MDAEMIVAEVSMRNQSLNPSLKVGLNLDMNRKLKEDEASVLSLDPVKWERDSRKLFLLRKAKPAYTTPALHRTTPIPQHTTRDPGEGFFAPGFHWRVGCLALAEFLVAMLLRRF